LDFDAKQQVQSFYIHWPFCPYRCHFCPFVALAGQDQHMGAYHAALMHEIAYFLEQQKTLSTLKTVFFGGGTPSTYPLPLLKETVLLLRESVGFEPSYEMTIEVNPGTVTQEKLETWKEIGVTRLSIGVQSLNDAVLTKLNRHQRAADVYMLMEKAAPLFDNLSIDVIVGLPGISVADWKHMIETVVTWPIKHISMYFLTVHEDTQLYFGVQQQKIILPPDDEVVDTYYWTIDKFAQYGIMQYEISNFARPGWESKHNTVYWQRKPYKAFGLGACSFDGYTRFQNEKNLLKYMQGVQNDEPICIVSERLTDKQIWLETLMLGLRQRGGVAIQELCASLDEYEKKELTKRIDELLAGGLLHRKDGTITVTCTGLSVVNEIVVKLSCIDTKHHVTKGSPAQDSDTVLAA